MSDLMEKALNVSGIIDYQSGAVVSRTIMENDRGGITLFSFDSGQGLSEHTAPFDAFVYIVEGEAEITIAGNMHKVNNGEMIVMPANKPHSVKASSRFKMMLVMIREK